MNQQQRRQKASARKRAEDQARGFSGNYLALPEGAKLWKPEKAGTYRIRILPYVVGKGNPYADEGFLFYERTFYVYRGIGPNEDTVIALAKTFNTKDPIAEFVQHLQKDAASNKEQIKALRPKERQMFNILDMENMSAGVQIFEYSNFAFGELLDERVRSKPDKYEDFWDAEKGMILEVTFKEQSMGEGGGKFLKATVIDFEPAKPMDEEKVLSKTYCLDKLLVPMKYEALYKLFFQEDFDADAPLTQGRSEATTGGGEPDPWDDAPNEKETPKNGKKEEKEPEKQKQTDDDDWLSGGSSNGSSDDGWGDEPASIPSNANEQEAPADSGSDDNWADW